MEKTKEQKEGKVDSSTLLRAKVEELKKKRGAPRQDLKHPDQKLMKKDSFNSRHTHTGYV